LTIGKIESSIVIVTADPKSDHITLIFFTLIYSDRQDRRLEAFEMWILRRTEMISWLDKVTDEEVLRRVNEDG